MGAKQFKLINNSEVCTVQIGGPLNEQVHFPVLEFGQAHTVVLDLSSVEMLNSMGLRGWIDWLKGFKDRVQLIFRHCPRCVVDQMNILQGFLPLGSVVESFEIPFYCDSCGHTENFLASRGRDFMEATVDVKEGVVLKPSHPCQVCGHTSQWDIIPAKYFAFLKHRR